MLFRCGAVRGEGRRRVAIVSTIEMPRCFATPTFVPHSGRFASLPKKDERKRPRVFLNVNKDTGYSLYPMSYAYFAAMYTLRLRGEDEYGTI